jgi:ABC-type glycerol-3-phosphate transport system permease component
MKAKNIIIYTIVLFVILLMIATFIWVQIIKNKFKSPIYADPKNLTTEEMKLKLDNIMKKRAYSNTYFIVSSSLCAAVSFMVIGGYVRFKNKKNNNDNYSKYKSNKQRRSRYVEKLEEDDFDQE